MLDACRVCGCRMLWYVMLEACIVGCVFVEGLLV